MAVATWAVIPLDKLQQEEGIFFLSLRLALRYHLCVAFAGRLGLRRSLRRDFRQGIPLLAGCGRRICDFASLGSFAATPIPLGPQSIEYRLNQKSHVQPGAHSVDILQVVIELRPGIVS